MVKKGVFDPKSYTIYIHIYIYIDACVKELLMNWEINEDLTSGEWAKR